MIKKVCILVVFSLSFLFADLVCIFSVPKSGTFLAEKLVIHMGGKTLIQHLYWPDDRKKQCRIQDTITNRWLKRIIIIRDLRDVICSNIPWMTRSSMKRGGYILPRGQKSL